MGSLPACHSDSTPTKGPLHREPALFRDYRSNWRFELLEVIIATCIPAGCGNLDYWLQDITNMESHCQSVGITSAWVSTGLFFAASLLLYMLTDLVLYLTQGQPEPSWVKGKKAKAVEELAEGGEEH